MENVKSQPPQPLVVDIYNQNYETKKIDVFSDVQEKHTGIIDVLGNRSEFKNKITSLMRIQMPLSFRQFMFSGFWLNGKKYMYGLYFSAYQHQIGIIDCPLTLYINDELKFKLEIPLKSEGRFSFYPIASFSSKPIQKELEAFDIDNKKSLPKYQLCVIATNKTGFLKKVNILDKHYFPEGFEDKDIKIEIANCYLNNDKKIEPQIVRGFSFEYSQLMQDITLNNGANIVSKVHLSANQQQSNVIDIPFSSLIGVGDNFEFNLLPNTKVMYYFL